MPEQALYLKWRPQTFDDVIGQDHITRTLRNALIQERIRHAYLFSGPRGTGKTTMARLLAKAINCTAPDPVQRPCNECPHCIAVNEGRYLDLIEIDAASHTGVDDVRDLREKIAFAPSEGGFKVYIIDEVHRFSGAAFDALLKTLEEPPDHAIFVLATTEFHKVPATIKSRCLIFEFRRVSLAEVTDRLALIAEGEGVGIDHAALQLIAREGTGSVRDSISLLDQMLADPDEYITLAMTEQVLGTASGQNVIELTQAIIENDAPAGLNIINAAVDGGTDPRQFGRQVIEHLRQVLLVQIAGQRVVDVPDERRAILDAQAEAIGRKALLSAIHAFNKAVNEWQGGWQPQLPLELAFLEGIKPVEEDPLPPPRARSARTQADLPQPVPEEEPPPAEPEEPREPGAVDLGNLRQQWPTIQRTAKRYHHTLPAVLDHMTPRDVRGTVVTLGAKNSIFKTMLEEREKIEALLDTLYDIFGLELQVKVIVTEDKDELDAQTDNVLAQDDVLAFGVNDLGGELSDLDE